MSCGKNKESQSPVSDQTVSKKDKFTIVFEGLWPQNDSLVIIYKKDGYWDYDHPVHQSVKGQPIAQKITFELPDDVFMENFQITLSTNKNQSEIQLNSIGVLFNDELSFDGSALQYVPFFNANEGLQWIESKQSFELKFGSSYPPGMVGNQEFEKALQAGL